jgi:hypothetical protein
MILPKHHSPAANGPAGGVSRVGWLAVVVVFALAAGGCVQTNTSSVNAPPPAVAGPLVLNSGKADKLPVGGATADPAAPAPAISSATPAPAAAPEPAPNPPPAPAPAVTETPPASPPAAGVATSTEPLPTEAPATPPAPKKDAAGYPNISVPPDQPAGTLLSAEERQKVIAELEALRNRQKEAAGADEGGAEPAGAVAKAGATHGAAAIKQIEKCSDEKIAATDPECQAPGDAPAAD